MLPRRQRLHADRDWDTLFRDGFGISGPLLSLRVRPTPGARRVGVSVGKKVGGAVTRNRVKRRLRAVLALHWNELPEADMAVLARPATAEAPISALETSLLELAARAARRKAPVVVEG